MKKSKSKNKNNIIITTIIFIIFILTGGTIFLFDQKKQQVSEAMQNTEKTDIANPASINCEKKGGVISIEKKPTGGEYGVCVFEDKRQCEEWTLMRSECPEGGAEIKDYTTDAQRYCVITGGKFVPYESSPDKEKGECLLPEGSVCDVDDYYNDNCPSPTT